MNKINERIFIISKILYDKEFYFQNKNLNLNFSFYDFIQYPNMFVDERNIQISKIILLTILLIFIYNKGNDILKIIKYCV